MNTKENTTRCLNAFDKIGKVFASMETFGGESSISKPELLALEALSGHEGLKMSEIAKGLGVGMSTATGIADRLIEKKLATRVRNGGDRRVVRVALTKRGRNIEQAYEKQKKEYFACMMRMLTAEEQEFFVHVMEKIAYAVQKSEIHGDNEK